MHYRLLIVLALFIKTDLVCQQNYLQYAAGISKAETMILHDHFDSAFIVYDQVFVSFEKCFPNDVFIAAQAASVMNDFKRCWTYLKKGFEWGLKTECLRYPAFKAFNSSHYSDSIDRYFPQLHAIYQSRINQSYRQECLNLYYRDQKANRTHQPMNILIPALAKRAEKRLDDTCAALLAELRLLMVRYDGFPSVVNTGVRDTFYANTHSVSDGRDYWIIATLFWHYSYAFQEFDSVLYNAVLDGNLSAWHYALIRDFSKIHYENSGKKKNSGIKYQTFHYNVYWLDPGQLFGTSELLFYNSNRQQLGLMSLQDEQLKKKRHMQYYEYAQKPSLKEEEKKYLIYFDYYYL